VSALAFYRKAASLAPNNATYWRLLALFSADNGVQILDVGLPAARKAGELAPNDPQVLDTLGWSYAQAGLLYNAEQTLLKATSVAPDSALVHLHLAETYLRRGDQASALRELRLARQLDGNGPIGQLAGQLISRYFP
jgi:tetratricopeptide (TPR) repeat protein